VDLIEEEAVNTDIVYHFANCDHEPSATAIAKGLARRQRSGAGYWIHTSGTGILGIETLATGEFGSLLPKVYNDWDGIEELKSHPDEAPHRKVDKIVLSSYSDKVKTAIVCPPTIYGAGRGPDNKRSVQAYRITEAFLKHKRGFKVGKSENVWHGIHVQDLSELYLLLGEAAINGGQPATWNEEGYYLAEDGSFVWGDILQKIANIAAKQGLLADGTLEESSPEEADKYMHNAKYYVGTNSRGVSIRGKKLLGWKPVQCSLEDELPTVVNTEASLLGLIKSHAEKVQG
jgi:nucleoside-diphosphate-sugar epimerase